VFFIFSKFFSNLPNIGNNVKFGSFGKITHKASQSKNFLWL